MQNVARTYGLSHIDNAQRNRQVLLSLVWEKGETSRKELAALSGLSIATTKRIVEDLLKENIILETGSHKSKRGRRTQLLSLNPDFGYSLGLAIYQNAIDLTAISFAGTPIYGKTISIDKKEREELIENIKRALAYSLDTIQSHTSLPDH